jgi:hypothetical protein
MDVPDKNDMKGLSLPCINVGHTTPNLRILSSMHISELDDPSCQNQTETFTLDLRTIISGLDGVLFLTPFLLLCLFFHLLLLPV